MDKRFLLAASLALAAAAAAAQTRSGVVGTMSGSGALSDVGGSAYGARPLPSDPRVPSGIDPQTGAPTPPASAPAPATSLEPAPAPASRPPVEGSVWGTPRPNPEPARVPTPGQN
ncbi:MAG TPA: hypothetical protein VFJ70_13895 [Burkholderiales bacterium]|nr:hypothetical protein [Burkholderiales bacterium]